MKKGHLIVLRHPRILKIMLNKCKADDVVEALIYYGAVLQVYAGLDSVHSL